MASGPDGSWFLGGAWGEEAGACGGQRGSPGKGGREGINSQIGSRPDEEESRSLMRGLGRVSVGCGIAFLYRMLSVDLLGKAPLTS